MSFMLFYVSKKQEAFHINKNTKAKILFCVCNMLFLKNPKILHLKIHFKKKILASWFFAKITFLKNRFCQIKLCKLKFINLTP